MTQNPFPAADTASAPQIAARNHEITQHGETRQDPYAWLRADNWQDVLRDPAMLPQDIREMLDAENAYCDAVTGDLKPLEKALLAEMRGRIKEDESSLPVKDGPFAYFSRFREGGQYPLFVRTPRDGGDEEILLDGDVESEGAAFYSIGALNHSPSHSFVAIAVDVLGSEYYTIRVRDMASGDYLDDKVESADSSGAVWAADSKAFIISSAIIISGQSA